MKSVYIETSVVSHASARTSSDVVQAGLQSQAIQWWTGQRHRFSLVTSQLVLDEAARGDREAASRRLAMLAGIPLIPIDQRVDQVAREILARSLMPPLAFLDALHVAAAAVGGVQYLLTLNCRHIASAHTLPAVYRLLDELGYRDLLICTPIEFLGGPPDESRSRSG